MIMSAYILIALVSVFMPSTKAELTYSDTFGLLRTVDPSVTDVTDLELDLCTDDRCIITEFVSCNKLVGSYSYLNSLAFKYSDGSVSGEMSALLSGTNMETSSGQLCTGHSLDGVVITRLEVCEYCSSSSSCEVKSVRL